jgi:hypothetical protein
MLGWCEPKKGALRSAECGGHGTASVVRPVAGNGGGAVRVYPKRRAGYEPRPYRIALANLVRCPGAYLLRDAGAARRLLQHTPPFAFPLDAQVCAGATRRHPRVTTPRPTSRPRPVSRVFRGCGPKGRSEPEAAAGVRLTRTNGTALRAWDVGSATAVPRTTDLLAAA